MFLTSQDVRNALGNTALYPVICMRLGVVATPDPGVTRGRIEAELNSKYPNPADPTPVQVSDLGTASVPTVSAVSTSTPQTAPMPTNTPQPATDVRATLIALLTGRDHDVIDALDAVVQRTMSWLLKHEQRFVDGILAAIEGEGKKWITAEVQAQTKAMDLGKLIESAAVKVHTDWVKSELPGILQKERETWKKGKEFTEAVDAEVEAKLKALGFVIEGGKIKSKGGWSMFGNG